MSYKDDKIKILEIICSQTDPMDLDIERVQEVEIYEDELAKEGFSYYGAMNLIKDFYENIRKLESMMSPDGKRRGMRILVDSEINSILFDLKYPNHQIESWIEEDEVNGQFIPTPQKMSITIDNKKGIYQTTNPKKIYQIKIPSKKFSLIEHILTKDKVSLSELEEKLEQNKTVIMKAIKEINTIFMKKLSSSHPLIIRLDTSGYSINRDKFDIKN